MISFTSIFHVTVIGVSALSLTPRLFSQDINNKLSWANSIDCPVKILGAGAGGKTRQEADLFRVVTIGNASSHTVTGVQFAWVVSDLESGTGGILGFSPFYQTKVPHGELYEARNLGAKMLIVQDQIKSLGAARVSTTLGVSRIEFEDGSEWNFHFGPDIRFINNQSDQDAAEIFRSQLQKKLTAFGGNESSKACITPEEAKQLTLVAQRFTPQDCNAGPQLVCNPGLKLCQQNYQDNSCQNYTCFGYGCQSACCVLDPCTGKFNCFN